MSIAYIRRQQRRNALAAITPSAVVTGAPTQFLFAGLPLLFVGSGFAFG